MFNKSHILITGGSGSFGTSMVRYLLANYNPTRLIIYSRDEAKQYEMQRSIQHPSLRFFIGDVRDLERLKIAFRGVNYVIHAAALKHVPAAEYNPMECIKTNVLGSNNVIDAAIYAGVEKVIALSTDKAANPINLYGASKLAADKLFVAANMVSGTLPTRFSIVRYGNVVNSRGSLIPLFRKLISEGVSSLPITDMRMTRFWITLKEAVSFVDRCFYRMQGGEVFVPRCGSSSIVEVARVMAPHLDVHEVGLRPGEKLHEVLCPRDCALETLEFDDHYVLTPSISLQEGISYLENRAGERGRPVHVDFEYSSLHNSHKLSSEELVNILNSSN